MVRENMEEDREAIMVRFLAGLNREIQNGGITTLCGVGGYGAYGFQD